jgi:DNA-directed RNA polymerase specialized sigma24 family protein
VTSGGDAVGRSVEHAHREHWPVLLAGTVRLLRDPDAAEACVQDAFAAALRTWRADGVPANPAAWLTTATRNRALDGLRRSRGVLWVRCSWGVSPGSEVDGPRSVTMRAVLGITVVQGRAVERTDQYGGSSDRRANGAGDREVAGGSLGITVTR